MTEAGAFRGLPLGLGIPLRKAGRRAVTACCCPLASHPSHLLGRADWTRFLPSIGYWGLWPSLSWSAEALD